MNEQEKDIAELWDVCQELKEKLITYKAERIRLEILLANINKVCPKCYTISWSEAVDKNIPGAFFDEKLKKYVVCSYCQVSDLLMAHITNKE